MTRAMPLTTTSAARNQRTRCASAPAQRGVALVVALVLLVVALLLGLAGIRGTLLQERMSSNMYDRSLAFQRAESALRAAEAAITDNSNIEDLEGADCSPEIALCESVPDTAFTQDDASWVNVSETYDVNDEKAPDEPQYTVQFMGTGSSEDNLGLNQNADYNNYGNSYPPDNVAYYRVTARSSNPETVGDRSIVVLQTTVKRPY
jgi:type IV pilus assembly protein PilX